MKDYSSTINLPKTDFPMKAELAKREPSTLDFWNKIDIYKKTLEKNKEKNFFILHDGPPYANGHIHLGTALNKILKDTIIKFKSMQNFWSPYIPGWDCHGMPIEHQIFQNMNVEKNQVNLVSFRKKAKAYAEKFISIQREEFKRLGVFADWENPYLTINPLYEKIIIESFGDLYLNGFIYQGIKPIYWCFQCQTALAEAEVEYYDISSDSIYVKFPVKKEYKKKILETEEDISFVIWTTTPWTLPANVAIAVNPEFQYALVKTQKGLFIILDSLVDIVLKKTGLDGEKLTIFKGRQMEGIICRHPFIERDSVVVLADYVSITDGTGCVHTAPGHGEDDYQTGLKYKLPVLSPVDEKGRFTEDVDEFKNMFVFDANKAIIKKLADTGSLLFQENYTHSYPHCWRCKNPVIFRATKQWFLNVDKNNLRTLLEEQINSTKWIPEEIKNRIGSMVKTRPDWCLSRQRLWGVPLPVFYCKNCGKAICTKETINNIMTLIEKNSSDIWFEKETEQLLPLNFLCPFCGNTTFEKEKDILDVWFDSGVSHLAVLKKNPFLKWPATLYLEGSDQHRGWFQSSLIVACAIEKKAPFEKVLTHGFVVDAEGKKMSKSLGNIITPQEIISKYGADVLRLWGLSENYQQDLRISKQIIDHLVVVYRTIRNTIRYLLGNMYDFQSEKDINIDYIYPVDIWVVNRAQKLINDVTRYYEEFSFNKGIQEIFEFCNLDLSSFYLDYLKDRLYTYDKNSIERKTAQKVIYQIFYILIKLLSPVLPFTCEEAYQSLIFNKKETVFLEEWPVVRNYDKNIIEQWGKFLEFRKNVLKMLEEKRTLKEIGSSLQAKVVIRADDNWFEFLNNFQPYLVNLLLVSQVDIEKSEIFKIIIEKTEHKKCQRCWIYHPTVGKDKEFE